MAPINWALATERAIGKGHPTLADTINRAVRQILQESGYDPDADPFPGLPPASRTWNAARGTGATNEAKIESVMDDAIAAGSSVSNPHSVIVPLSMIPFNAGLITQAKFASVRLVREGGDPAVFDISAYGAPIVGASSGSATDIITALQRATYAAQQFGGGVISLLHQSKAFYISGDFCNNLQAYERAPITFWWGPAEYRFATTVNGRSHHHHYLHGSYFKTADATGARLSATLFVLPIQAIGGPGNGVTATDGTAIVTKIFPSASGWNYLEVGSPVSIFGRTPVLGKDTTTINVGGGISDIDTTITVVSTTGFLSSNGYIRIEDEVIFYTGTTATAFTGCTRGFNGTAPVAHADTTLVARAVREAFVVKSISGDDITLDSVLDPRAVSDFTATNRPSIGGINIEIGTLDFRIAGHGTIDGLFDPDGADDTGNPVAIFGYCSRKLYVGPGITFRGFDFGAATQNYGQDAHFDGCCLERTGSRAANVGSGIWLFGGAKRNKARLTQAIDCLGVVAIDDRSTSPTLFDQMCYENTVECEYANRIGASGAVPFLISGGKNNSIRVRHITGAPANSISCMLQATQWQTNVGGEGNLIEVDSFTDYGAGAVAINVDGNHTDKPNTVRAPRNVPVTINSSGCGFEGRKGKVPLTDAATIAIDVIQGDYFEVLLGGNRTLGIPSNPVEGQEITLAILQDGTGGRTLALPTGAGGWAGIAWSNTGNVANTRSLLRSRYSKSKDRWEPLAPQTAYA